MVTSRPSLDQLISQASTSTRVQKLMRHLRAQLASNHLSIKEIVRSQAASFVTVASLDDATIANQAFKSQAFRDCQGSITCCVEIEPGIKLLAISTS